MLSSPKLAHPLCRVLTLTTARNAVAHSVQQMSLSTSIRHQGYSTTINLGSAAPHVDRPRQQPVTFLRLNNLQDNPGAVKQKRRVGRGIGSSKGKTSGRGQKGQKSRSGSSISPTFEGGQTPFYKLLPKRGFRNAPHATPMVPLNLKTIQMYVDMGRLNADQEITVRALQLAGLFKANAVKHGVKLLADGELKQPLHLKVSRASVSAIAAVEAAGGSVVTHHYNQLALRTVLRPEKFEGEILPRQARPPPKWQPYYTSWKNRGYLNPAVQMKAWLQQQPQSADLERKFDEIWAKKQKGQQQQQD